MIETTSRTFLPSYRISADRVVPVAVPGLSITTTYDVFRSIEILRRADVSLIDTRHIHHINYGTFHTRFQVAFRALFRRQLNQSI
jgi:hypothetical protein